MKALVLAATIAAAAVLNLTPASAAQYGQPSAGPSHWVWQYHYVGRHHPHMELGWVLVK